MASTTRLTGVSVTTIGYARTRLTGVSVQAAGPTLPGKTRLTRVYVTATTAAAHGKTRLTRVFITAATPSDGALPSVFYWDSALSSYEPYTILSMDDYPW